MKKTIAVLAVTLVSFATLPAGVQAAAPQATVERCGCSSAKGAPVAHARKPKVGDAATCPVMKSAFKVSAKTELSVYKGKWYAFCCPGCKPKFDANPAQYAGR